MNKTYNKLLELVINELSLSLGAKAAGRTLGKAKHATTVLTAAQKRREIESNPAGGPAPSDPKYGSTYHASTSTPTPKTQAHSDASDYEREKVAQAARVRDKFKARAAAAGSGSGGGPRGSGTTHREGQRAGEEFTKISGRTATSTQRKLGSGASRIRSLFGARKARKYSKTDVAHREHFDKPTPLSDKS